MCLPNFIMIEGNFQKVLLTDGLTDGLTDRQMEGQSDL